MTKPLLLDHFEAEFGHATRKDGGQEPMVFLTMHVRTAGTTEALPTVWVPPAQLQRLIQSLQALESAIGGHTHRPPDENSH